MKVFLLLFVSLSAFAQSICIAIGGDLFRCTTGVVSVTAPGGSAIVIAGSATAPTVDLNELLVDIGSDQVANYCLDAGASDTYACNLSPAIASYVTGAIYRFKANTANTGACTLNLNSVGAVAIKKLAGGVTTDPADNDIRAGQWVEVVYDGTNFQMVSQVGNASSGGALPDQAGNSGKALTTDGSAASWATLVEDRELPLKVANATGTTISTAGTNAITPIASFADAADNKLTWRFPLPGTWDAGTLTLKVWWHSGSSLDTAVVWGVATACIASGDTSYDPALNTEQTTIANLPPDAGNVGVTTFASVTTTGCAAGEVLTLVLHRLGSDAADTSTSAAIVDQVVFGFRRKVQ